MKKKIFGVLRFFLFFGAALFLIFLAIHGLDLHKVLTVLKKANYAWLGATIPLGILSHWIRAMRWNLLIYPLGFHPKTKHTFYAVMTGYLTNLAIPRLGEVARCGSLTRSNNIPFDKLIGTVIVERAIDLLVLILLFLFTFLVKIKFFGHFFSTEIIEPFSKHTRTLFDNTWVWLSFGFFILFVGLALWIFWNKVKDLVLIKKISEVLSGILTGIKTILRMEYNGRFILLTLLLWLAYYLTTWLIVFTLPETSSLKPIDGLFLLVAGSLGMIIPVQGGIGAYHWILSRAVTIYGISPESGLALATIAHESQILIILLLGTWSVLMVVLTQGKQNNKS